MTPSEFDAIIFTDNTNPFVSQKSFGAYKVAHILRQHGYTCLVVDHLHCFQIDELTQLLELCVTEKTKFVGFSIGFFANIVGVDLRKAWNFNTMNFSHSFFPQGKEIENQFVAKLKSLNSNCKIVLGGPQAKADQISNKNVNYVVLGYAEISIVKLMQHLESGQPLENSYKNLHGVVVVDDRAAAAYDFRNCTMRWLPEDVVNSRVLPIEISRGCIFNCKYCQYPLRGKKNNDYLRAADHIQEELQYNYDHYGITTYSILDDTFNDNDEKLDLMLLAVKKLTFQPIFWCYSRLDLFHNKPERVDKVFDIGVRSIFLGIETLNRDAGLAIGKGMHAHKQIETIKYIREKYGNDLLLHGNFIIGLPGETAESVRQTADMITTGEIPLHTAAFSPLKIYKGANWWSSEIDSNYEKFGYIELPMDNEEFLEFSKRAGFGSGAPFMLWKSDIMTYIEAEKLGIELFGQLKEMRHISNYIMWGLIDCGQKLDDLKDLKLSQLNMSDVKEEKFRKIAKYKTILFDMLTSRSK